MHAIDAPASSSVLLRMRVMTSTQASSSGTPPTSGTTDGRGAALRSRGAQDVPYGITTAAAWSWRILIILAMAGVIVWLSRPVSTVIISVAVAALLAGLLYPAVRWLRKHRIHSGIATAITELGAIILVVGLLGLVGQQLVVGFSELSDQVVAGYQQLMTWLSEGPLHLSVEQVDNAINSLIDTVRNNSQQLLTGAAAVGSTAGEVGTGLLITLFTLIFFLLEGERIWLFLVKLFPQQARRAVNGAGRRGWNSLVSYARIQVFVAFVDAVGIGLSAFFLGVPLAFPLGVLVFLGSFIPVIGAVATGAVAVLLALVANGPVNALLMLIMVLLVQQIESHILQPLVMGKAVSLHPLAVVLAVALGSMVMGIVGALFAVPVMAVLNTVVRYLAGRQWEHDTQIRTEPFKYPWEIARESKKTAAQRVKDRISRGESKKDAEEAEHPAGASQQPGDRETASARTTSED
jgi:predicted PurR-regulated permease PerM